MSQMIDFELKQFLPYRLSVLANTISQGIAASYRDEHGISITEWRIMAVLGRFPGLTASEAAERTAMDKVAIHRAVKTLLARSLIERRTDPEDRRRQNLFITPEKGQAILDDVIPRARDYERTLLAALTPEEADQLCDILDKLQGSAKQAI